jgi:hypothetical protein
MMTMDWSAIAVGVLTLLNGCGWFVNWRKDKQEAKGIVADNKLKEMELAKRYVDDYNRNIVEPLQQRVLKLEAEIRRLQDAIQSINDCPHSSECPVLIRMRKHEEGK